MKKEYEKLYVTKNNEGEALKRLVDIVKILRVQCPWDRAQTHESLRKCMIEEAYEAVEAINNDDIENLREELGDVLLQVVFHSDLSENEGNFDLTDVINEECEKMLRRHPHIFLEESAKTIDKALEKWENMKSEEHAEQSYAARLRRVPSALPALIRSSKVQSKASKTGFDWEDVSGALDKLDEELRELREACDGESTDSIFEEFGDVLFSMVNVSRFLDIDPEESLNASTRKFIERFEIMEKVSIDRGLDLQSMTLEEMDNLWIEAKNKFNT